MGRLRLPSSALVVALLAACQPSARRALLLDLALGDPALLEGTATPWSAAGYAVEYRRFYPHLTRDDMQRYGVVLILGGRTPERWSDALGTADIALLTEWVPRGGVLVFGYAGDGEGSADRWVMNRWLAGTGTGIVIGDAVLQDTARVPAATARHPPARTLPVTLGAGDGIEFPAGRNHPLRVRRPTQVLARTISTAFIRREDTTAARGGAPVVAAARVGRGLVIIASRHLLGALGPEVRASTLAPLARDSLAVTRRFLVSLARWTRRPAEWAAVPPAQPPLPVTLPWPVRPLAVRAPPLEPPPGVEVFRLPRGGELDGVAPARDIPEWIAHQGLHIGWSRAAVVRPASLDSLLGFSDAAGLNVLASPLGALLPADSATASAPGGLGVWRDAIARVGATSLHWFPLLRLAASTDSAGSECLLDETAWAGGLVPALRAVAALARGRADPLAGVALELTPTDTAPPELCDSSLRAALPRLGRDSASIARLLALPAAARFEALLVSGMLGPYVAALESELAARAATVAQTVRREAPELMFALWSTAPLAHWQAFGLARGFGAQERATPVLLWDTEPLAAPILAAHRARRVTPLHAVGLAATDLSRVAPSRRTSLFTAHDGFWIGPIESFLGRSSRARGAIPADSLARLVRRISKTG